jgi:hypothetical protein
MDKDYLVLKRASTSRSSGEWNDDDYDVVAREEFKKLLNRLDDWARSSNRICRFLAFGGRFPCKSILRIPSNRKP